jgi:hypothetical protein
MSSFLSLVEKLTSNTVLSDYVICFNESDLLSSRFINLNWICRILEGVYVHYSGDRAEAFDYSQDNWQENLPRLIELAHLCELNEVKSDETLTDMLENIDSPNALQYFCDLLSGILDTVDDERVVTMFPPKPHRVGASGAMTFFTSSSAQRSSSKQIEEPIIASSPTVKGMTNSLATSRIALVPFGSPKPALRPIFSPGTMVYNTAINLIQTFIPGGGRSDSQLPLSSISESDEARVAFEERELQFEREKRSVMVVASSQSIAAAEAREDLMRVTAELELQRKSNAELQNRIIALQAFTTETSTSVSMNIVNSNVDTINHDLENTREAVISEKEKTLVLTMALESFQKTLKIRESELQDEINREKQRANLAFRSSGAELVNVKADLSSLKSLVKNQVASATRGLAELSSTLAFRLADAERGIIEAKSRYLLEQTERRKVLNALQEAKGSIRVLARVRPLLNHERAVEGAIDPSTVIRASSSFELTVPEAEAINSRARFQESKSFEFERVFSATSTQAEVFAEVQPLVQSALDGYHACIFAYGQTGSGKTHTMEGGDTEATRGVYFRSLNELFNERERRSGEWDYSLRLSIVEIYNETVVDLLADAPATNSDDISIEGDTSRAFVEIKQGPQGVHLPDAVVVEVHSQDAVEVLMKRGSSNRSVGRTNANEHSSRSHSLLILDIHGTSRMGTGEKTYGRLVLVDLAGSERLSKSGAEGMRLKEAQAINSSLSALGDVISAMGKKASHVPFRNSKLTYLLQDSLGKGRTMMIANLSPTPASRGETLCTLTFASRVRKVEVGKAIKHADNGELKRAKEAAAKAAEEADAVAERAAAMSEKVNELTLKLTAAESELVALKKSSMLTSSSSTQLPLATTNASADAIAAAVKRTTEDITSKMKIAQTEAVRRATLDAETAVKAEAEKSKVGLLRQVRELQTALERADAKSKDAIAASVQAARVAWERERERDRARTTRSGRVPGTGPSSRKQSLSGTWLASSIATAGINSVGTTSIVPTDTKMSSTSEGMSTSTLISAVSAVMLDERTTSVPPAAVLIDGDDEYIDPIVTEEDFANEGSSSQAEIHDDTLTDTRDFIERPISAETDVEAIDLSAESTTNEDSVFVGGVINEKSVTIENPFLPFCEDGPQRLMIVSPIPSSFSLPKAQTPSSEMTLTATTDVKTSASYTLTPPSQSALTKSLTPFKVDSTKSTAIVEDEDDNEECNEAHVVQTSELSTSETSAVVSSSLSSQVVTDGNNETCVTGQFTFGSRERARLAGLPSPKPVSGILKQGTGGTKRRRSNPDLTATSSDQSATAGAGSSHSSTSNASVPSRPTRGKKTVALLSPDMANAVRITAPQPFDGVVPQAAPHSTSHVAAPAVTTSSLTTTASLVANKKSVTLSRTSSGASVHAVSTLSSSLSNRSSTPAASRKPSVHITHTQQHAIPSTVPSQSLGVSSSAVTSQLSSSPRAALQPRPTNVISALATAPLAGAKRSAPAPSDLDVSKKPRVAASGSASTGPSRVKVDAQTTKPAQKGAARVVVNASSQGARRA